MHSKMKTLRLLLLSLRILQCTTSLVVIIIEFLRHDRVINLIEKEKDFKPSKYELIFEYFVMNLGFVASVLYIFRLKRQFPKRGSYKFKFDILLDCILMNAWMIFGILRLTPQLNDTNFLACSQYEPNKRKGCIVYISTLALGYFISASYFLTSIASTWICTANSINNSTNNSTNGNNTNDSDNRNCDSSKLPLNRSELNESNEIRNSQVINDISEIVTTQEDKNSEFRTEITLKEFIEHNKHLAHLFKEDSELNMTDGTIVLHKPAPCFLKYESPSRNSSLYSLDSSFSRIYGSIIISRKHSPPMQNELDTNNSSVSSNGSLMIGRNKTLSIYSDKSSSALSDKTSRSSRYDGSIIIKLVT